MAKPLMFEGRSSVPPQIPPGITDPLAEQIDWTPAAGGGANFRTHKLVVNDTQRVTFVATLGARLFCSVFLLIGLAVTVGIPFSQMSHGKISFSFDLLFPVAVGMGFAAIGGVLLYFNSQPIVFDKRRGFYWKGRKAPDEVFDRQDLKHCAKLADIHALQIVSESCSTKNGSYRSYELNLVLKDGTRINVIDHGSPNKLREDAATLSQFLERPVWDATLDR